MRIALRLGAILLLVATAATQAPTVSTILDNGTTQTRYDIVVLGDGYQASEQAQFNSDALAFATTLFTKEPYATFADYYNVHTVFRASTESGANHPDATPPIFVNNAYGSSYNTGGTPRCLYIGNSSLALADASLAPATEGRVMVIVNDNRYGGCASTFAVSYNGSAMTNVLAHELGHSLGQLADEYDYPNNTYTGGEPSQVNVTTSPSGAKWSHWHGTDGISAHEGARYYLYGLYRPRSNCMMRNSGQPLCRVCQENITRITNSVVDVITASSPAGNQVNVATHGSQAFSITHFVPAGNNPIVQWTVDGSPVGNNTSYLFDAALFGLGQHTVMATVLDQSDRVRTDPLETMREERIWTVDVISDAPDLQYVSLSSNLTFANPGGSITLTSTIENAGLGDAQTFDVEFFVSQNNTWSPQDTYLGKTEIQGLPAGQTDARQLTVQLPYSMATTLQFRLS